MYFDNFEGMVFRPPSEAKSLILRVTIGCSENRCTFCKMYKDVGFRIISMEEISCLIQRASHFEPDASRIFLGDGNALALSNDKLLDIMHMIKKKFPKVTRISCYGGPKDILRKSVEELVDLREMGMKIIYMGIESGDDEVLADVRKGVTADEMIAAGQRVVSAGIKLSAMLILGLGGREKSLQHALNSARVVNGINPDMLSVLTLMLQKGTILRDDADNGKFHPLSPFEMLQELKVLMENIDVANHCIFRSNHSSNFLPLGGTLPEDKTKMLIDIDIMREQLKHDTSPTYNNTGRF
jgi:radical SAM superfamily enzyme YgiQ (UPF0313 family)